MTSPSITDFFKILGAPLKNPMWSWGAQRENDGTIFLRAWQDEKLRIDNAHYVMIFNKSISDHEWDSNGIRERLHHIEQIKLGNKSYIVMIRAVDTSAIPRKIASFNSKEVFEGGEIIEYDNKLWLRYLKRQDVRNFMSGSNEI